MRFLHSVLIEYSCEDDGMFALHLRLVFVKRVSYRKPVINW